MDIYYVTCPDCSKDFYCDEALSYLDVELLCPYCGSYFRQTDLNQQDTSASKIPSIVRWGKGKRFYKPKDKVKGT